MFETEETCWPPAEGTAAPKAADEVVTRNSLRVDLSEDDIRFLWKLMGRTRRSGKIAMLVAPAARTARSE